MEAMAAVGAGVVGGAEGLLEDADDVDPLDAFMAGEVLPEVRARQEAEAAAKEAERIKQAELLASGKAPVRPTVLSDDSEEEPEPDSRIQIPANKIKLMVGAGGVKIMEIQRKSKCRIQVLKEEDDLNRAWGSGQLSAIDKQKQETLLRKKQQQQQAAANKFKKLQMLERQEQVARLGPAPSKVINLGGPGEEAPVSQAGEASKVDKEASKVGKEASKVKKEAAAADGVAKGEEDEESSSGDEEPKPNAPPRKMATILLYGDHKAIETAERMIYEAIDNKAQKVKQRERDYAKKREEKSRNRQMYILRHTRNYEILEVPVGASRAEVKKAYRRLALLWHPDKHPNNQEEAQTKFQAIQKAYESLMSTSEDERIEALGN